MLAADRKCVNAICNVGFLRSWIQFKINCTIWAYQFSHGCGYFQTEWKRFICWHWYTGVDICSLKLKIAILRYEASTVSSRSKGVTYLRALCIFFGANKSYYFNCRECIHIETKGEIIYARQIHTLTSAPLNSVKNESTSNGFSTSCRKISSESLHSGSNELRSHELPGISWFWLFATFTPVAS